MKKTCFVIIGFGVKTDFETGRRINLDKTYENIIKPVFDDLDIFCFRACDLEQSGVIDVKMYESILKSDYVVADISTLNPNAIYELGVRHALKPNTTIVIAEDKISMPFDVNHVFIHTYRHLEEDIGASEATRFKEHLKKQMKAFVSDPSVDSPVYTFLPNLKPPLFTQNEVEEIEESVEKSNSTADLVELAERKKNEKKYELAKDLLQDALKHKPNDSFITQRLALIIYKSELPTAIEALHEAEATLQCLHPETTTDPETLGLLGAINKRLFEQTEDIKILDKSLYYYERGYYVKQDYYNGINVAFLHLLKASISSEKFDMYANYGQSKRIWSQIVQKWDDALNSEDFKERSDKDWLCFTLAEAYFGLGNKNKETEFIALGKKYIDGDFTIDSYESQRAKLKACLTIIDKKIS